MTPIKQQNFDNLIDHVYQTDRVLQENALKVINQNLSIRNWLIGCYIVEYEQNGEDRAVYGERLIDEMSKALKTKGLKGFSPMSLRNCRTFYKIYPQIQQTVSVKLQDAGIENVKSLLNSNIEIQQTVSVESKEDIVIPPELLLSRLSFSHFIELIRVEDSLERLFYEVESIKNN